MPYPIEDIEGIGDAYGARLREIGINTTGKLLTQGATATGRKTICEKTGIPGTLVLTWVNHCDLMRINGIGPEYSELLEAAGVDSVIELKRRNADSLHHKLKMTNDEFGLTRHTPSLSELKDMIAEAATLEAVVEH